MHTRAILTLLGAGLAAGCTTHFHETPHSPPVVAGRPVTYSVARGLSYTPVDWPVDLPADVYTPDGHGPFPAVLVIHGGGWSRGSRSVMNHIARALARRGFVAVNADYRLAPQWSYPAPVDDLREALRWIQQHAVALNIDPDRIGAWGYSAGAQLAAMLAAQGADTSGLQAIVLGALPADLVRPGKGGNPVVSRYIGQSYTEAPARYAEASPLAVVSSAMPPTFLYSGTRDRTVNQNNSREMHRRLRESGVSSEWFAMHGYGHVTAFMFDGNAVDAGLAFLDRRLSPPGLQLARERRAALLATAAVEAGPARGAAQDAMR